MIKGFNILLGILGYVPTIQEEMKKVIYPLHISIFLFISGYLYDEVKYNSLH